MFIHRRYKKHETFIHRRFLRGGREAEDIIKSTGHLLTPQLRKGERTLMRRGLPERQKQEGSPKC
jgi:hypothetical protein